MASWFLIRIVGTIVVLAVLLCCQGCTIRFKAKDVELDSVANSTFELESVGVLCDSE